MYDEAGEAGTLLMKTFLTASNGLHSNYEVGGRYSND